jgi:hypothetical protein
MFATTSQSAQGTSAYWQDQMAIKAELVATGQRTFYITSIDNRRTGMVGGQVFPASAHNAANRLADGTHKKSTPEEIERYHRERDAEVTRLAKIEESRKNTMTIRSSPEDDGRLAGVVAAAVQAALGAKPERAKQDK